MVHHVTIVMWSLRACIALKVVPRLKLAFHSPKELDMSVDTKHPHYHKDVSNLQTVDVYRVLALFNEMRVEDTVGRDRGQP